MRGLSDRRMGESLTMNTPSAVSTGLGCLLLCAGAASALPGCMDTAPVPDVAGPGLTDHPSPAPGGLSAGTAVVGEYVLHVSPRNKTAKMRRVKPKKSAGPGFHTQSVDTLNYDEDGVAGSGAVNTVELVTTSVDYGYACLDNIDPNLFCAHVDLGNFYTRTLNNVFVQVTAIKDGPEDDPNSQDLDDHGSVNSDAKPTWLTNDQGLGLWKYTGLGVNTAGVVGTTATSKVAGRDWVFADPDGQDTYITLRVIASLSYRDYERTASTQANIDACSLQSACAQPEGCSITAPLTNSVGVIPFPFTFYSTQATTKVRFTRDGVVTFGETIPPSADHSSTPFKNINLPENPVSISASPGIFVFWDQLDYTTTGYTKVNSPGICYASTGSAPNRRFILTWRNMRGLNDPDNSMNLTFSAILYEGSEAIDFTYGSMVGTSANDVNVYPVSPAVTYARRAAGKKAVIGVQGGGIASPFPAVRGGLDTSSGKAYRFTPIP